jgi:hypothetical protein
MIDKTAASSATLETAAMGSDAIPATPPGLPVMDPPARPRKSRVRAPAPSTADRPAGADSPAAITAEPSVALEPLAAATPPAPPQLPDAEVRWGAVGSASAAELFVHQGAVGAVRAERVSVEQGAVGAVASREFHLTQGVARAVVANDVTVEQGFVRAMLANRVRMGDRSGAFIIIANRVEGNVRALLDWRSALALGAVLGLVIAFVRRPSGRG